MSEENVEFVRRWYEVATSKADLLAAMPPGSYERANGNSYQAPAG